MNLPEDQYSLLSSLKIFGDKVAANAVELGLSPAAVAELTDAITDFEAKCDAHLTLMMRAKVAGMDKANSRATVMEIARRTAWRVRALMPEDATLFGLDRPKKQSRIPAPKHIPKVSARALDQGQIEITFRGTGSRGGKPKHARNCEIWVKIGGDPPESVLDCRHLASPSRSPYIATFDHEMIGKPAHFILRWTNPRGESGPESPVASATIPL